MSFITGQELIFGNVKLTQEVMDLINKSPILVRQLLNYSQEVLDGRAKMIAVENEPSGMTWNSSARVITFGIYDGRTYDQLEPWLFVGILSHEIGHYVYDARNEAREKQYASLIKTDPDIAAMVCIAREGDAAYNNWRVAREIVKNGGAPIAMLGDRPDYPTAPGYDIYNMLSKMYDANVGKMPAEALEQSMVAAAGSFIAQTNPGGTPGQTYYEYCMPLYGAEPKRLSKAPVVDVKYALNPVTGLIEFATLTFSNGESQTNKYDGDGLNTATLFGANGKLVEHALFDASGFKTHDIFYASNGKKTQQYEFSVDGTSKKYVFNIDGSQTVAVFDKNGKMAEYVLFDVNGFKTHDIFYASNGKKTEQYDYRTDKSFTKYLFNDDGSQVVALFGANGQMKEYASFDAAGTKTQANYFAVNGAKTQQYDFHADKSLTKYVFGTDGSQTVALFGANGQITEYAAFNANGFKTQGIYYGADGSKAKQFDFKLDGSFTAYTFNSDGSQTAALFGANGQMTEHATFNAAGKKTLDLFYGANGKVEKKFEFNPDGTYMSHVFNHDGTQAGALFGSNGKMIEYAAFDASGFNTKYVFYNNGARAKQYDFSVDKSYVARTFDGYYETAALFGVNNIIYDYYKLSGGKLYERGFFDKAGRQVEMDRFNTTTGAVTGFTKYAYNNDGTYWASDYNASGYMTAKSQFSGDGQWISNASIYVSGGSSWGYKGPITSPWGSVGWAMSF